MKFHTNKFSCKFPGCPAKFLNKSSLEKHEQQPHVKCENNKCGCGRYFLQRAIGCHLSHKIKVKWKCKECGNTQFGIRRRCKKCDGYCVKLITGPIEI